MVCSRIYGAFSVYVLAFLMVWLMRNDAMVERMERVTRHQGARGGVICKSGHGSSLNTSSEQRYNIFAGSWWLRLSPGVMMSPEICVHFNSLTVMPPFSMQWGAFRGISRDFTLTFCMTWSQRVTDWKMVIVIEWARILPPNRTFFGHTFLPLAVEVTRTWLEDKKDPRVPTLYHSISLLF